MNRAARRTMARCKHDIVTKTDGNGDPCLSVCRRDCGWEQPVEPKPVAEDEPTELDELERRVGEKWAREAAALFPDAPEFDVTTWTPPKAPASEPLPQFPLRQFPREQWITYPARRTAVLTACEQVLDGHHGLALDEWQLLCLAMLYGGRVRIA